MEAITPLLLILFLSLSGWDSGLTPNWRLHTFVGISTGLLWIARAIWVRVHPTASLAFLVAAMSMAWVAFSPEGSFLEYSGPSRELLMSSAAQSCVFLLCIIIPVLYSSDFEIKWILNAFEGLCVINSVIMLVNYCRNGQANGLINNPSINATFIVMTLPMVIFRDKVKMNMVIKTIFMVLPISAILAAKSSTAWTGIVVGMLAYALFVLRDSFKKLTLCLIFILADFYAIYKYSGWKMLGGNGRYFLWQETMAFYIDSKRYILGLGGGTWHPFLWEMQKANGMNDRFLSAHSEPIQVLFEQGALGLLSLFILYSFMIYKSWRSEKLWLFVTVMVLGVCTLTQFPFRIYLLALFYTLICRVSFDRRRGI